MMETIASAPWQMWATLGVILVTIGFYTIDRFPLELVSAGAVVALLLLFLIAPVETSSGENLLSTDTLLSGFASPALFAILGLLIIGQGMFQAGALEHPTEYLLRAFDKRPLIVTGFVFLFIMVVSAFLNNTPVVVMFIPIMAAIAQQSKIRVSRFMMPLSYLSILGGMTTLIGSSTNLLAAQSYRATTGGEIGFFELTPMGLILAGAGILYMLTAGRWLLPKRSDPNQPGTTDREGKHFIAQIEINRGHPLIGKGPVAGLFVDLPDITVRMVQRRERAILPPFEDFAFRSGDVVVVAATRSSLASLLKSNPDMLEGLMAETSIADEEDGSVQRSTQLTLVEAIVAPGSRLIGRSVAQIGFHAQTNCVILGIERRSRMIRTQMNTIRLEAGDVLLILGDMKDIRALRADRDILLLEYSMQNLPDPRNARIAALIFAGVIGFTASGLVPIAVSAIVGATLMVATGCLNVRQAARAVDRRIYLLIGASLAMGVALERTGGAAFLGEALASTAGQLGPTVLISAFFIMCAAMTNVLSNNATAVLFTPIAVAAAKQVGMDEHVLVLTVIFGSNCSFATPIAYQTNLLVMTPGHYKFRDFIVVGGPLIILLWIVYSFAAPYYYGLN
ncbi:SLC13 family permease [Hyphococcus flavus]|uniref:SLC13 family permease n=1 Tax=Hyphococcus flavus TaxID=1866326 RepID=A0AAE9ZC43_9PROT|nr:SLC13 family permease [Hyphococcus flavus]WDI30695.1 SLC13 family permease [Hyphococcus flavus]